jgi:hypothetical protein
MTKKAEYEAQAKQYRALAEQLTQDEYRNPLLNMAATWERLAARAEAEPNERHPSPRPKPSAKRKRKRS